MRQNIALQKAGVPSLGRGLKDVFPTGNEIEKAGIRSTQGEIKLNKTRYILKSFTLL